ncbi:ABC transporter substrate-binding protein [Paucibacter soli]|uniref:ABC transporter substrate-binding protein n=1 Tax=Paucibacter soli TaxID=3133433 RepID=UPI00309735DC
MPATFPYLRTPMNRRRLMALLGTGLAARSAWAQPPASLRELERAARAEGRIHSLGMPDSWANWRDTWAELRRLYGLVHSDRNMTSGEEIALLEAEGRAATVDIGDVGFEFGAIARSRGVTRPYKPSNWAEIPDWAKDADGHWALAYTGTIAFLVNTRRLPRPPRSWQALFKGQYRLLLGEVGPSAQANAAVLAAAVALGGNETQLQPALAQFAPMHREGRLLYIYPGPVPMNQNLADVHVMWDFVALAMRKRVPDPGDWEIFIPEDGSITSGYTTIINKHAPHPNAAMLTREYIFSDAGQTHLARGHARPIRVDSLELSPDVARGLIAASQYQVARALHPAIWAWEAKKLTRLWQAEVLARAS